MKGADHRVGGVTDSDLLALCKAGLARYERWERHDPGSIIGDTQASRDEGELLASFQAWCFTEVPDILRAAERQAARIRELEDALRQRDTEFCKALIAHLDPVLIEKVTHTFNEIRSDRAALRGKREE